MEEMEFDKLVVATGSIAMPKLGSSESGYQFAKQFKKSKYFIPLVSVPSTYSKVYEKDLIRNGFKIVIYAN